MSMDQDQIDRAGFLIAMNSGRTNGPFYHPTHGGGPRLTIAEFGERMEGISTHLKSVIERPEESIGERVKRLQEEARGLSREHIRTLEKSMAEVTKLAREIAAGGDAYHVGVRELAVRIAEDVEAQRQTIEALMGRRGPQ